MNIQTCFSPAQFQLFNSDDAIVVVIDILRATSAICTGFEHGINKIIPVATIEEAKQYQNLGYVVAAERDGKIVDGFNLGNSPFDYMNDNLKNKDIVMSTTNGTQAISAASNAYKIVIGSFLNLTAVANFLISENRNIIMLCAGWKNKFNLEDSLFAGALASKILVNNGFETQCDSTFAAMHLYDLAHENLFAFLDKSSHRNRLKNLNLEKDIEYCLSTDLCSAIPIMNGNALINQNAHKAKSVTI